LECIYLYGSRGGVVVEVNSIRLSISDQYSVANCCMFGIMAYRCIQ
jgi:hypothetical protein